MSELMKKLQFKIINKFSENMKIVVETYRDKLFRDYMHVLEHDHPHAPRAIVILDQGLDFVERVFESIKIATFETDVECPALVELQAQIVTFRDELIVNMEIAKHFNRQQKGIEDAKH